MVCEGIYRALTIASVLLTGSAFGQSEAAEQTSGNPEPLAIAEQGKFFVGGNYNAETEVVGQMYVEYQIPQERTHEYPVVFIHGGGQIGSGWWTTPDGREGWAPYFLRRGYAVYVVDVPGRGRSAYNSELGAVGDPATTLRAQQLWAAHERFDLWPAAELHTQWVGDAIRGDPTFEQFMRSQAEAITTSPTQEEITVNGLVELLDQIGPSILVPHSQPGMATFRVADQRPNKVKALIELEPGGPSVRRLAFGPFAASEVPWGASIGPITYSPTVSDPSQLTFEEVPTEDDAYVESCWLQKEPARQLVNLAKVPMLLLTSPSGYNTLWDPCTSRYLDQAGVEHTWTRLEDIGIEGNGHFYFIEKNSNQVADVVLDWLKENVEE